MIISDLKYWKFFDNIYDAQIYIDMLTIDGHNNWRVPTLAEYQIIRNIFPEECEGSNPSGAIIVMEENLDLILRLKDVSFENHFVIPVRNKGN